jgi:hypothetical protein
VDFVVFSLNRMPVSIAAVTESLRLGFAAVRLALFVFAMQQGLDARFLGDGEQSSPIDILERES